MYEINLGFVSHPVLTLNSCIFIHRHVTTSRAGTIPILVRTNTTTPTISCVCVHVVHVVHDASASLFGRSIGFGLGLFLCVCVCVVCECTQTHTITAAVRKLERVDVRMVVRVGWCIVRACCFDAMMRTHCTERTQVICRYIYI